MRRDQGAKVSITLNSARWIAKNILIDNGVNAEGVWSIELREGTSNTGGDGGEAGAGSSANSNYNAAVSTTPGSGYWATLLLLNPALAIMAQQGLCPRSVSAAYSFLSSYHLLCHPLSSLFTIPLSFSPVSCRYRTCVQASWLKNAPRPRPSPSPCPPVSKTRSSQARVCASLLVCAR